MIRCCGLFAVFVIALMSSLFQRSEPDPSAAVATSFSIVEFVRWTAPPALLLVALGVLSAWMQVGAPSLRSTWRFVSRRSRESVDAERAAAVLTAMSRTITAGGLLFSFTATLLLLGGIHSWTSASESGGLESPPLEEAAANAVQASSVPPEHLSYFALFQHAPMFVAIALILGRVLCDGLADGARVICRSPSRSTLATDLGLLAALAIPPLCLVAVNTPIALELNR